MPIMLCCQIGMHLYDKRAITMLLTERSEMEHVETTKPTLSCLFHLSPGVNAITRRIRQEGLHHNGSTQTPTLVHPLYSYDSTLRSCKSIS
jgi:hypothetical protein